LNPINPYPNASLNGNFIRDIITAAKTNKQEEPAPVIEQKAPADKSTPSNIRAFTFYSKLGRDKVKEIQTNLKKLGYDVEVNGLINDRLVNAVKAF
jgi:N-acetyl-anhydromuramyl-L-alanine amidase AmpD